MQKLQIRYQLYVICQKSFEKFRTSLLHQYFSILIYDLRNFPTSHCSRLLLLHCYRRGNLPSFANSPSSAQSPRLARCRRPSRTCPTTRERSTSTPARRRGTKSELVSHVRSRDHRHASSDVTDQRYGCVLLFYSENNIGY